MTALLHVYAKEYPNLVDLESAGKSHEGRDIWLVTVTNRGTGNHQDKPAFWCDGNIHASEVSASTSVLYILNKPTFNIERNLSLYRRVSTLRDSGRDS